MLRCECRSRLGRGWRFCESCGRPVTLTEAETRPVEQLAEQLPVTAVVSQSASDVVSVGAGLPAAEPVQAAPNGSLKAPAVRIGHFNWRFALAPVLIGAVLGLLLAWLSVWTVLIGVALGAIWGGRRWRAVSKAMSDFEHEWVFDKVIAYGACALGARAWWPSGILYLTDQTLKFKPFNHTNEREVSLDPSRLTGFDFPETFSWPADWRCFMVTSNYGPVFGTMKLFDRVVWEQTLKEAKARACSQPVAELS